MWIVRLVGSIATLELKAAGSEYGPGALNEANAIDFCNNGADIPRSTMKNSFVRVQWHGESSFRETSLMI
jgi:hypothetical protein